MQITDVTNFRKNLAASLDQVNDDREPLLIKRTGGAGAVLLSEEDYSAYEEMRHLTASINNVTAINEGIRSLNDGQGIEISADDLDAL